jgi:diguanylate cyclase (GGDEF)-like protein
VLQVFCDLVAAAMRPGDLFGRLGGEEFACLLADTSITHALQTAERVRREFEAMRVPGLSINLTVSVGVAMASEAGRNLPALLTIADRALYRAKADGRNRVAPAPLVVVDTSSETARRTWEIPGVISAPLAGQAR